MVSYRAKGINKFTAVNLRLLGSNRRGGIFLLAALLSTGSPPATARLLRSTRSGVTCLSPPPDAVGGAKNLNPKTTLREGKNVIPTAPESPHSPVWNRHSNQDRIGRLN
jgi:hypothetical protein